MVSSETEQESLEQATRRILELRIKGPIPRDSAEYRYKVNKQSRPMFQGLSQNNNPQAKVIMTVPRAAWHQGDLNSACGALQEWTL